MLKRKSSSRNTPQSTPRKSSSSTQNGPPETSWASQIQIGCIVPVLVNVQEEKLIRKGEIIAIRATDRSDEYYIHYIGFNKRLDEWIPQTSLQIQSTADIQYPKKKKTPPKKEEATPPTPSNTFSQKVKTDDIYKIKNIEKVEMGEYTLNTWYFSPYPFNLAETQNIILCEYCLFYFGCKEDLQRHFDKCTAKRPPGTQIYRKNGIAFFELDGQVHKNYSRNLSLLSKLFLDHKTLYYDIDVFLFYVMCLYNPEDPEELREYKLVGYFSKEKESQHGYNVACILILPQYQRKGYGRILIDFSYLLSKKERVAASPEKPLSDLGLLSYRQYWVEKIIEILIHSKSISLNEIKNISSITIEDIVHTLQSYNMLMFYNGVPSFILKEELLNKYYSSKKTYQLDPEYLLWDPPQYF
ncbi:histone acetyltransferase HTATIP [Nematocida sp. AWRm80]|nr:histone acetyltransferase HTATIP [Nematocida sp. AWRm80]